MTRRERLMATLRGEPVDRPPVSFYELNGFELDGARDAALYAVSGSDQVAADAAASADGGVPAADPFDIYTHPSWRPLIELARDRTDRIVMRWVPFKNQPADLAGLCAWDTREDAHGSRFVTQTVRVGKRVLTRRTRRDRDVNTVWTLEHLLKDLGDLKAYLELPETPLGTEPDTAEVLATEARLGDSGIVMLDTADPLCWAADLFEMGLFTVVALTEPALFHRLLERFARFLQPRTEAIARALPGRLWRLYGPEYASPPYLPPRLFREYVNRYDTLMVAAIQRHGGFARLHAHGHLREILDCLADTGGDGLDPIEPPPQGDVELAEVRARYGRQWVLFGNLEISDLENLPPAAFAPKVERALREGTAGGVGRGFVLMPSACPYGRVLSPRTLANYRLMVERVEAWG